MDDDDTARNAEFVGRVVSDPKDPPETRMLTGWLGDAAEEGNRRLYADAELSSYLDIPAEAILHTEPIRDSQPSGGVFVWIRRDAALKQGGSTYSRAARFLQGQVQQDFAGGGGGQAFGSPEEAGYRCITQVPCGEPTGFTGRCTKQPDVGGAWPCITAIPNCFEPTGFTGKCTHQPWPNPTQYVGCTIFHCPTQDLTHIPHICNLVATGMPGCPVVDPPGGGINPEAKASAAAEDGEGVGGSPAEGAAAPVTSIPGCGYTRLWGLCQTLPPKCTVSVHIPCITRDNACGPTRTPACLANVQNAGAGFAAFRAAAPIGTEVLQCNPSAVDACPTRLGCETQPPTVFCTQYPEACPTQFPGACPTQPEACPPTCCGPQCQTQQQACTQCQCTQAGPQCPVDTFQPGCPPSQFGVPCPTIDCTVTPPICFKPPPAGPQAFRAAGPIGPSAFAGCTQAGNNCLTIPNGDCTFFGGCQQTQATVCTQSGPQCPTQPHCTCQGPGCPPTPATVCTQSGPQCPSQFGSGCNTDLMLDCTFGCTQAGPSCQTNVAQNCNPNLAAALAAQPVARGGGAQIAPLTVQVWQCQGPTPVTRCFICPQPHRSWLPWQCPWPSPHCPPITQTFPCGGGGPSAVDACPTRLCGGGLQRPVQEPTPATVCFICTQVPQLCPVAQ